MITRRLLRDYYEGWFIEFESSRDRERDVFTQSRLREARNLISGLDGISTWLDVGSGFSEIAQSSARERGYVGLDLAIRALIEGRRRSGRKAGAPLRQVQADAGELPFPAGAFDLVSALELIEHTIDPAVVIREVARVARRWLVLSLPTDPDWSYTRLGIVPDPYQGISRETALTEHVGHISVMALVEVRRLLDACGVVVVRQLGLYSLVPPPFKLGFDTARLPASIWWAYALAVRLDHRLGRSRLLRGAGLDTVLLCRVAPGRDPAGAGRCPPVTESPC